MRAALFMDARKMGELTDHNNRELSAELFEQMAEAEQPGAAIRRNLEVH